MNIKKGNILVEVLLSIIVISLIFLIIRQLSVLDKFEFELINKHEKGI